MPEPPGRGPDRPTDRGSRRGRRTGRSTRRRAAGRRGLLLAALLLAVTALAVDLAREGSFVRSAFAGPEGPAARGEEMLDDVRDRLPGRAP